MHVLDRHQRQRDDRRDRGRHGNGGPESQLPTSPVSHPALGDHTAGAEQHEEETHRVVRLPARHQRNHEQNDVREAERTVGPRLGPTQQPPKTANPQRREERADQQKLERKKLNAVTDRVLLPDLVGELELGPAVASLPEKVRQPQRERESGSAPQPGVAGQIPAAREKAAARERHDEKKHELLVFESDAGDQTDEQPLPRIPAAKDPRHDVHQRHPDQHVEGRRREKVADRHRRRRRGRCQRRHRLSRSSCAQLPGDQGDKHDNESHRDSRQHPQPARVRAEHPFRETADKRGKRRLVVVPPRRMSGGDTEVQLVPVIAVTVRRHHQQQELSGCDRQYEQPGDSIPPMTQDGADSISPDSSAPCGQPYTD